MATYRQVFISFWQDNYILDLEPEGKLLFIYLLTNTKTTQCGIYELPMKVMQFETGLDKSIIEQYLQKFEADGKILYSKETSEVFIVNWLKYNNIDSSKVRTCIRKELMQIKNKNLLIAFLETAEQLGYGIEGFEDLADTVSIGDKRLKDTLSIGRENSTNTLSIGYGYPICDSQIPYGEEKEKEKEKEIYKEQQQINNTSDTLSIGYGYPIETNNSGCGGETSSLPEALHDEDLKRIAKAYQENGFGLLPPAQVDTVLELAKEYSVEWVILAFQQASIQGHRSLAYVRGILKRWKEEGQPDLGEGKKAKKRDSPRYKRFDFSID